jgi:formylglycine-generating enzyme required for sulfatase activity
MAYDVFISYSHKDVKIVDRIEEELHKHGLTCFVDRSGIDLGNDFGGVIAKAITESDIMLFVWSENANQSDNTANEIALAIEFGKTIVPFKIGKFVPDYNLAYRLVRLNRLDVDSYNETHVVELGKKIIHRLGKDVPPPPPQLAPPTSTPTKVLETFLTTRLDSSRHPAEPEMVLVEGGAFQMGSTNGESNEKPVHQVTLSSYYIGKYEVTQAQWQAIMGSNPSYFNGDNLPIGDQVSWDDVQEFIKRLNAATGRLYALPTEAQWEFAARGGNKSRGYTYSGSNNIDEVAWYDLNSGKKPHPVGKKKPNELGIYDMSGNVYEWCRDWNDTYPASAQTNPVGPSTGSDRVIRGGSWLFSAQFCRSTCRGTWLDCYRNLNVGFRLVLLP